MANADSKWDKAIQDASAELQDVERRRGQLQRAIRIFRANKRDRLRWPGDDGRFTGQKAEEVD